MKFSFLSKAAKNQQVGVEVRPEGIAVAVAKLDKPSGKRSVQLSDFLECKAGKRQQVLSEWVQANKLKGTATNLVMSADQYKLFQIDRPEVEEDELAEAIPWKIKDMIDYEVDDAVVDFFEFPKDAAKGRDVLNVVSAKKVIVKGYVDLVLGADLDLQAIDITELALRNVLVALDDSDASKAMLYLRKGAGILVFCRGDMLYFSRRTAFSLENLSVPAEQAKVIENLSLEVQRSLDYCESQLKLRPPRVLSLAMPSSTIPLANMLGGELAVSVEDLPIGQLIVNQETASWDSRSLGAIGGALRVASS